MQGHSDASNDGHNLPLSQPHQAAGLEWIDTSLHAHLPIIMLMHCSLMLWKQMELSHQG